MITEAHADLARLIPLQNHRANSAAAIIFQRRHVYLNDGLIVHRSDLAVAVLPCPYRIANVRVTVEMNALLRGQGQEAVKQRRSAIAARKGIMRQRDQRLVQRSQFVPQGLIVCLGVGI